MIRRLIVMSCVMLMASLYTQTVDAGCKGCDTIASGKDGFCCSKGSAFGVKIPSKELYAALVGNKISAKEAAECPCNDCKKAAAENGRCDNCKYIAGKLYKSPVSYALAKGTPMSQELIKACPKRCEDCKSAFKSNGKCEHCSVGFVAGRMFENDKEYKAALVAFQTLTKAVKVSIKCAACAVALVTDGKCESCKVQFKDGKIASTKGS